MFHECQFIYHPLFSYMHKEKSALGMLQKCRQDFVAQVDSVACKPLILYPAILAATLKCSYPPG